MPVKPENRARYPAAWPAIALAIKTAADWVCQNCGMQCRRPGEAFDTHRRTLTTAHLDHCPEHCDSDNLRAWCSGCHNRYDMPHRQANAAATRKKNKSIQPLASTPIVA